MIPEGVDLLVYKKIRLFPARMQVMHNMHMLTIEEILKEGTMVIVLGSIQESYTLHDPFTGKERHEEVSGALNDAGIYNIKIVGVPDFGNDYKWSAAILEAAGYDASQVIVSSQNPWTLEACAAAQIETVKQRVIPGPDATRIREMIAQGKTWEGYVPAWVAKWLKSEALRVAKDENRPGIEELDGLSGAERIKLLYQKEQRQKKIIAGK